MNRKVIRLDLNGVQSIGDLGLADLGRIVCKLVPEILNDRIGNLRRSLMQPIHLIADHFQHIVGIDSLIPRQCQFNHDRTMNLALLNGHHTMGFRTLGPSKLGSNRVQQTNAQTQGTHTNAQHTGFNRNRTSNAGHKSIHSGQNNHRQCHLGRPAGLPLFRTTMQPRKTQRSFAIARQNTF